MEKKIIEIITQTHLTPKEQAIKVLDLFSVMLSKSYKEANDFSELIDGMDKFYGKKTDNAKYYNKGVKNMLEWINLELHSA